MWLLYKKNMKKGYHYQNLLTIITNNYLLEKVEKIFWYFYDIKIFINF